MMTFEEGAWSYKSLRYLEGRRQDIGMRFDLAVQFASILLENAR